MAEVVVAGNAFGMSFWNGTARQTVDLAGRRILIVEDEVIVAFNMECEVVDAGGTVVGPAHTVAEALSLIDQGIDAAILDINIAGELVWPVAERLAAAGIPMLLASANCHDSNAVAPAFANVPCFDKPVSMHRLLGTLAEMTRTALPG